MFGLRIDVWTNDHILTVINQLIIFVNIGVMHMLTRIVTPRCIARVRRADDELTRWCSLLE